MHSVQHTRAHTAHLEFVAHLLGAMFVLRVCLNEVGQLHDLAPLGVYIQPLVFSHARQKNTLTSTALVYDKLSMNGEKQLSLPTNAPTRYAEKEGKPLCPGRIVQRLVELP